MSSAVAAASPPAAAGRRGPGRAFWLVGGAVAAFGLFLLALAFPPDLQRSDGGAHALSRSPVGYAGVVRLLQASGVAVHIARTAEPSTGLLVVTPAILTTPAELSGLIGDHRALVIAPKWLTAPDPHRPERIMRIGELTPDDFLRLGSAALGAKRLSTTSIGREAPTLSAPDDGPLALDAMSAGPVESLRTLDGPGMRPVLVDGRGRALLLRARDHETYVLTDPDLANNHGVADLRTARVAVGLIDELSHGHPVVWDVTLNGLGEKPPPKSPLKALFVPPFLPATLCLFAAAALTGLAARGRFGAVAQGGRAYGFGKRALADSAASLFAMAGREPALAPRYAELARQAAASAAGLPPRASRAEGDAALDRIGEARGVGGWTQVAAAAQGVTTVRGLLIAARRAHDWRRGMTGGRG